MHFEICDHRPLSMVGWDIEERWKDLRIHIESMWEQHSEKHVLRVNRSNILYDTVGSLFFAIQCRDFEVLKKPLKVVFVGEVGEDEGGLKNEYFTILFKQILSEEYDMFVYNEETRRVSPKRQFFEYYLAGLLFGLAIYNLAPINIPLPQGFYRKWIGGVGCFSDLRDFDSTLAKNLNDILEYKGDDIYDTFGITWLKNGKEIPVTQENKKEYVINYVNNLLNEDIKEQFKHFQNGFLDSPARGELLFSYFRPSELSDIFSGKYCIETLKSITTYEGDYNGESDVVKNLWEILQEEDESFLKSFLMFVTGSECMPMTGSSLTIQRQGPDSDMLPFASTCFNILLLPDYSSKEKLLEKFKNALQFCEGFGSQ
ncbi:UBE3A [Cordylochernes scorpioides]|uniref:HECT-type E3 ubiquitin transferase n=1 Tax=Cordylochernes scorpioides TaxID=51811 RepID=A0ABY6JVX5_9ARAC|nr:UBE3A [Cordylochernes scorpioides]